MDALYVDMMIEVNLGVFRAFIKSSRHDCWGKNLTELEVFKSILDVFRPREIEGVNLILNYDRQNISQVL